MAFLSGEVKLDIFFFYEDDHSMWNAATVTETGEKLKQVFFVSFEFQQNNQPSSNQCIGTDSLLDIFIFEVHRTFLNNIIIVKTKINLPLGLVTLADFGCSVLAL